jgi:hypothetical protein
MCRSKSMFPRSKASSARDIARTIVTPSVRSAAATARMCQSSSNQRTPCSENGLRGSENDRKPRD